MSVAIEPQRQAKVITISLYPEQLEILSWVARDSGMENISAAVRVAINDYGKRHAKRRGAAVHPDSAGTND